MRKFLVVAFALLVSGSVALAQNKTDTKWHCPKPTAQKFDVGDVADHVYEIDQGTCSATSSDPGESDGGNFTADSSLMKTVRVVTTVQYYLEK